MNIIAISDTHIKFGSLHDYLPPDLLTLLEAADLIIHAGDFVSERVHDELADLSRLEAVHGNMDAAALKRRLPEQKVIESDGIRIGIIHEAALSLQDTTGARYRAKEMEAQVLIFGHLHRPIIERSDVIVACPGSPTSPRMSEPAALELTIEDGTIAGNIITFEGTVCAALDSARSFHR